MSDTTAVDVLIVGAGPAGLMLATWLAKLKISCKIIDKRSVKVLAGQADGVQCRTVEVFQSFGFAHRLVEEGAHINEVCFWNPTADGGIERTKRTPDTEPGTSRFPHAVLTQGRIERFLLDAMKGFNNLTVDRSIAPVDFSLVIDQSLLNDFSSSSYPISVTLRHLSEEESTPTQVGVANGLHRSNILADDEVDAMNGQAANGAYAGAGKEEKIKAKFVVGCDGARSWVRKQLGLTLDGDSANSLWGVLDAVVKTDFPDIRLKCTIHSKENGSILVVPRENNLVRFYVQLGSTAADGGRVDRASITPEGIAERASRIFHPYKLEMLHFDWYSVYEVGQRICRSFVHDRVYLAGDSVHTHSPKAGQGMNTSMMDTYNLGWKIAAVLKGQALPTLLETYQEERHKVAQELIDLDYQLSRMFAAKPRADDDVNGEGISLTEFKEFFIKMGRWASGTAVHYNSNLITATESSQSLASRIVVGERFESHLVVSLADARPWHVGDLLVSDGRWRVINFAGDVRKQSQRKKLEKVAAYFDSAESPLRLYTPAKQDLDSAIDLLTIISNPRTSVETTDFPDVIEGPLKAPYGAKTYDKIYVDDSSPVTPSVGGELYSKLEISSEGCLVVIRPDQTVSLIAPLDEPEQVGAFFAGFLIPQN